MQFIAAVITQGDTKMVLMITKWNKTDKKKLKQ